MSPVELGTIEAAIGHRIRLVRSVLRCSQADFAANIGVKRGHLSHIEMHRIEPSIRALFGVLTLDIRHPDIAQRSVDPTWLMLGPTFEKDMWGKTRATSKEQFEAADQLLTYQGSGDAGWTPPEAD